MSDIAIGIEITAVDNASAELQKVQEKMKGLSNIGSTLQSVGAQMAGLGALIAAPLVLSVKAFTEFEQKMKNVQVVAGASTADFEKLSNAAKDIGANTRFSASEAADALYNLASAGLDASDAVTALDSVVALAAATNSDFAQSSAAIVSTVAQFSLPVEQAAKVADVFTSAISNSMANMEKLQSSMRTVGPIAGSMGISLESTTAALMALYNAGFQGEQAGTALRNMLATLIEPSTTAKQAFSDLGISIKEIQNASDPLQAALGALSKSGASTKEIIGIFGKEAGPAVAALLQQGINKISEYKTKLDESGGAASKAATEQTKTLQGMIDSLTSILETAAIEIGEALAPALTEIIGFVKGLVEAWVSLSEPIKDSIVKFTAVSAVILIVGGGITALVGTILKSITVWAQFGGIIVSTVIPALASAGKSLMLLGSNILLAVSNGTALTTFLTVGLPVVAIVAVTAAIIAMALAINNARKDADILLDEYNKKTAGAVEVTEEWYHSIPLIGDAIKAVQVDEVITKWTNSFNGLADQIDIIQKSIPTIMIALKEGATQDVAEGILQIKSAFEGVANGIQIAGSAQKAFGDATPTVIKAVQLALETLVKAGEDVSTYGELAKALGINIEEIVTTVKSANEAAALTANTVTENLQKTIEAAQLTKEQFDEMLKSIVEQKVETQLGISIDEQQFTVVSEKVLKLAEDIIVTVLTDAGVKAAQALQIAEKIDFTPLSTSALEVSNAIYEAFENAGYTSKEALLALSKLELPEFEFFAELVDLAEKTGNEIADFFVGSVDTIKATFAVAGEEIGKALTGSLDAIDFKPIAEKATNTAQAIYSALVEAGVRSTTALAFLEQIDFSFMRKSVDQIKNDLVNVFTIAGMTGDEAQSMINSLDFSKVQSDLDAAPTGEIKIKFAEINGEIQSVIDKAQELTGSVKNSALEIVKIGDDTVNVVNEWKSGVSTFGDEISESLKPGAEAMEEFKKSIEEVSKSSSETSESSSKAFEKMGAAAKESSEQTDIAISNNVKKLDELSKGLEATSLNFLAQQSIIASEQEILKTFNTMADVTVNKITKLRISFGEEVSKIKAELSELERNVTASATDTTAPIPKMHIPGLEENKKKLEAINSELQKLQININTLPEQKTIQINYQELGLTTP